ncbi:MAG: sugar phosphate isomerase/epimerase family protein [Fimbriimonadaceae bacterium]
MPVLKAINYLSFPGGLDNTFDMFEAITAAKELGYEALEPCIADTGVLTPEATEAQCKAIVEAAEKEGIAIQSVCSGTYWSRSLGDSDLGTRNLAQEDLRKMIQISAWLGAKTLLVIPGAVDVFFLPDRAPQPYDQVESNAIRGLRAALPDAVRHQVRLGIENVWNRFLLSPMEMAGFIDMFDSPWIGAYVDVGNVMPFGYPEQWLRILDHRVVGVHFKDFKRAVGTAEGFVDLLEGDVDWPEVVRALGEIGYDGPVCAELIPEYRHHPMVRVENASRAMDAILGR